MRSLQKSAMQRPLASAEEGHSAYTNCTTQPNCGSYWRMPEESQHTAMDILAFGNLGHLERTYKVLALKLLASAAHEIGSSPAFTSEIKSIYGQLWSSSHTPDDESRGPPAD